jgi:protein-S-isoprenylcysteine O-methyltransferase Ste14
VLGAAPCAVVAREARSRREMPVDTARYVFGVVLWISMPIAVGFWYAIHPFARTWRRIGPAWTYVVLATPAFGLGWLAWRSRKHLMGADLGTQPVLVAAALAALVAAGLLSRARRSHLTQRILTGIPELSRHDAGRLLTDGIYGRTRNPRYIEVLGFALAYAAFANHVGTWVLLALSVPALHLVVLLEECELRQRFGREYEEYCRRVPRYLPRHVPNRAR